MRIRYLCGKYEGYNAPVDAWFSYVRICGRAIGVAIPGFILQVTILTCGQNRKINFATRLNLSFIKIFYGV